MKIGDFLKTTKGKIAVVGGTAVVAVGIVVAVLLQGGGYRSILVEQVEGTVNVVGNKSNGSAYVGQRLFDGDDVSVMEKSSLTMCMDNDKYVYADANTHFRIEASPARDDSRIRIQLDKGSELNVLKSKLGANDSYEVDTPNSTMSVRGTTFRVTVYTGSDGLTYTLLEVKEGLVFVKLKTSDGTFNGVEKEFAVGNSGLIRGNVEFSEFVTGDDGEIERQLDYNSLPEDSVERLKALLQSELDVDVETGKLKSQSDDSTIIKNEGESLDDDKKTEDAESSSELDNSTEKSTVEKKTEAKNNDNNTESTKKNNDDKKSADKKKTEESKKSKKQETSPTAEEKKTETESTVEKQTEQSDTAEKQTEQSDTAEKKTEHTHSPGEWEVVAEATCTADGSRQKKCTSCGEVVDKESISATGHDWGAWVISKQATCTAAGSKYRTCNKCGSKETEKINMLGHKWVIHKSDTTGQDGLPYTWKECSRCGLTKQ